MLVRLTKTQEKRLRRERDKRQRMSAPGYLPDDVKKAKRGLDYMRRLMRQGTLEKTPDTAAKAQAFAKVVRDYGHTVPEWVRPYFKDVRP